MKRFQSYHFLYISFKHTPKERLLKQLHATNLVNRKMSSIILYFINISDEIINTKNNKKGNVKHMLLTAVNKTGKRIFTGVEQGKKDGTFYDDIFVLFHPSMYNKAK